jgi:hypothetical protein
MIRARALLLLVTILMAGYLSGRIVQLVRDYHSPAALANCFGDEVSATSTGRCIQSRVQVLLAATSTASLLRYLISEEAAQVVQYNCHAIGHIIGEETYNAYSDMSAALSQCTSDCRSACTHGVIGAGFAQELGEAYSDDIAHGDKAELEKQGSTYCNLGQSACHGMGHVAYIATRSNLDSLALCDAMGSSSSLREACYQGVFMERAGNFSNVLSPDEGVKPPEIRRNDYTYPCEALPNAYRHACFLFLPYYQIPLFTLDGIREYSDRLRKSISVCQTLASRDRAYCIEGIGGSSFLFGTNGVEASNLGPFCDSFTAAEDRNSCTRGVVLQYLYFDGPEGFLYCESVEEESRKTACYAWLFALREHTHGFTNDPARMCSDNALCLEHYHSYMQPRAGKK